MAETVSATSGAGGARNCDGSTNGRRSVHSWSPGQDGHAGQNGPAEKGAIRREGVYGDRRAGVHDHRRPIALAKPVCGHGIDEPIDANPVRLCNPHDERKPASGKQRHRVRSAAGGEPAGQSGLGRPIYAGDPPRQSAAAIVGKPRLDPLRIGLGRRQVQNADGLGKSFRAKGSEQPELDAGIPNVGGNERTAFHALVVSC